MGMSNDDLEKLGPLRGLVGTWEGGEGEDVAPSASRGDAVSPYRERMVFEFIGAVDNHEQHMFGLRYHTTAWRKGAPDPFHEDTGYFLWDAGSSTVMKAFAIPRGMTLLAGGTAQADDRSFTVRAEVGSQTFGIVSNPFLDREFRTERFELTLTVDGDRLEYRQDTVLRMPGRAEPFHHTDKNVLRRAE